MINIPTEIRHITDNLWSAGYEAYIVGGCVRDQLLGKQPDDYDVTTSAEPETIIKIFHKTVPTGLKHGTVTVIYNGHAVEVTTFRADGSYSDLRRPDSVKFVKNLKEDLARRDFTVNAIAYSDRTGIKDPFGGINDIKNRILRTVGDPKRRFSEDALRILRLFRFASQLDFSIEPKTLWAALEMRNNLKNVSRERISKELLKTICGAKPEALSPVLRSGAFAFMDIAAVPDFGILNRLPKNADLRLFSFLKDSAIDIAKAAAGLKLPAKTLGYLNKLSELCRLPVPETKTELKKALILSGKTITEDWLKYLKAAGINTADAESMLREIFDLNEPYLISHLAVNGRDLQSVGITGPLAGSALKLLQNAVIRDPSLNKKNILIDILNNKYS